VSTIRRMSRWSQAPEVLPGAIWWVMSGRYDDADPRFTELAGAFEHYQALLAQPSSSDRVWDLIGPALETDAAAYGFRPYHRLNGEAWQWTARERSAVARWRDDFYAAVRQGGDSDEGDR
jgi:hypothetical protein